MLVGEVLGHGRTYEEGVRNDGRIQVNYHNIWYLQFKETKITDGVYMCA